MVIVGVNVDKNRTLAERFLGEFPPQFPIVYDPQGTLAESYKVTGMPCAILIDRSDMSASGTADFPRRRRTNMKPNCDPCSDEPAR